MIGKKKRESAVVNIYKAFFMESLLINSQQADHLLRRRRRPGDGVYGSCSSSSSITEDEEYDEDEEVDLLDSSSSSSPSPLQDMSSLLLQLPLKRGLSKHYNGKSESFASLSNVKSLEDLAKQENPISKKLKLWNPPSSSSSRKDSSTDEGSHFSSVIKGGTSTGFLKHNFNINDGNIDE